MSAPKSVVKIKKAGVEYISSVDKSEYFIYELCRAALRDVGKYVVKKFRTAYYSEFHKWSGEAGRSIKYKVISGKSTTHPRVEVGLSKKSAGWYSMFQEFGSSRTKKLGLLQKSVNENVPEIIKLESQYLSALEDEAKALALIDEKDQEGDADD